MNPLMRYAARFQGSALAGVLPWVVVVGLSAWAGSWVTGAIKDAEIAKLKQGHADQVAAAERDGRRRLQAAQRRGDELTTQLNLANSAAHRLQEQLDDALAKVTTGRPCLGSAALRVLDRAPGIAAAPDLPAAAGGAAPAHAADPAAGAAAAGDTEYASDTDTARWIRHAAGQYAECTRRLDALIDWYEGPQQQ